ncbi:MAG: hypothetical protein IJH84_12760 [Saccharopolyspora sp.]|uniref:Uncharacterized protein n=1 Tax=Tsukamurella spumae TaxID=44753 RepID=A0A846X5I2_9ACTN|nr:MULTISPECIES: hypothetical protein [Actinomycetes]MBQ6641884.1 hypothetical protein [Saccharopolyspora sp.]NKY19442.1 hypothetical protein [Tsukamurella spumae]
MALHAELQKTLEKFVEQHRPALATVRLDLPAAITEVGKMWSARHADPAEVSGETFCADVRHMMRDIWKKERNGKPGINLQCNRGQGGGTVFMNLGTEFRLRKFLSRHVQAAVDRDVVLPPEVEKALASGSLQPKQMNLFTNWGLVDSSAEDSDDEAEPVHDGIYALWSTKDNTTLESLHLAVVRGLKNPASAEILALVEFPPATESPFYGQERPKPVGGAPADDFAHYETPVKSTGNFGSFETPVTGPGSDDEPPDPTPTPA